MSSRAEQLDHVVALLERFVSGDDRSKQFAGDLEKTADALAKYRMSFGSRFLKRRAQEVRK